MSDESTGALVSWHCNSSVSAMACPAVVMCAPACPAHRPTSAAAGPIHLPQNQCLANLTWMRSTGTPCREGKGGGEVQPIVCSHAPVFLMLAPADAQLQCRRGALPLLGGSLQRAARMRQEQSGHTTCLGFGQEEDDEEGHQHHPARKAAFAEKGTGSSVMQRQQLFREAKHLHPFIPPCTHAS